MRGPVTACLVAGLLLAGAAPAGAQEGSGQERAAAIARPAVVVVRTTYHGWVHDRRTGEVFGGTAGYTTSTSCSGVVVQEDGYIVTAGACVDPVPALVGAAVADLRRIGRVTDPAKAAAQLTDAAVVEGAAAGVEPVGDIRVERVTNASGQRDVAPARVIDLHGPGDVTVLKVPRGRLPALALADVADLPPGTPVVAIGYPETDDAAEPADDGGEVTTRRTISGKPFYEVNAHAEATMRGGPVVDEDGRVIGLTTATPADGDALVTASASVADLLHREDVQAGTSANDRNYTAGVEHYFDGDYAKAVEFFDAVLAATPDHPQARQYRRLAAGHGDPGWPLLVWLIVGCGAIAVLAGAAGATLLLVRRGRSEPPTPPYGFPAQPGGPASGPFPVAAPPADDQVTTPSVNPGVDSGKDGTAT